MVAAARDDEVPASVSGPSRTQSPSSALLSPPSPSPRRSQRPASVALSTLVASGMIIVDEALKASIARDLPPPYAEHARRASASGGSAAGSRPTSAGSVGGPTAFYSPVSGHGNRARLHSSSDYMSAGTGTGAGPSTMPDAFNPYAPGGSSPTARVTSWHEHQHHQHQHQQQHQQPHPHPHPHPHAAHAVHASHSHSPHTRNRQSLAIPIPPTPTFNHKTAPEFSPPHPMSPNRRHSQTPSPSLSLSTGNNNNNNNPFDTPPLPPPLRPLELERPRSGSEDERRRQQQQQRPTQPPRLASEPSRHSMRPDVVVRRESSFVETEAQHRRTTVLAATPQMRAQTVEDRDVEEGRRYEQQLLARCAIGEHAPEYTYGPCGIISSVLLFPVGLVCLCVDREKRCARCGEKIEPRKLRRAQPPPNFAERANGGRLRKREESALTLDDDRSSTPRGRGRGAGGRAYPIDVDRIRPTLPDVDIDAMDLEELGVVGVGLGPGMSSAHESGRASPRLTPLDLPHTPSLMPSSSLGPGRSTTSLTSGTATFISGTATVTGTMSTAPTSTSMSGKSKLEREREREREREWARLPEVLRAGTGASRESLHMWAPVQPLPVLPSPNPRRSSTPRAVSPAGVSRGGTPVFESVPGRTTPSSSAPAPADRDAPALA